MKSYLAFDLATVTGVAKAVPCEGKTRITTTRIKLKLPPTKDASANAQFAHKMIFFDQDLAAIASESKPCAIFYEEVRRFMSSSAAYVYCALRSSLLRNCFHQGIEAIPYSPAAIKKYATGKGNATKTDMLNELLARYPNHGQQVNDDNEVDAFWILLKGLSDYTKEQKLNPAFPGFYR